MRVRSLALVLAPLVALACKQESGPTPAPSATASAQPTASAKPKAHAALDRETVNRVAVRLNLPLYWVADRNKNGAIDPDEVVTLLFYPTAPEWSKNGAFTPEFDQAYAKLERAHRTSPAGVETPESKRVALVVDELDDASATLVESDLRAVSAEEKTLVRHMSTLAKLVDELFMEQNGSAKLAAKVPDDPSSQSLFRRSWGPRCETPKMEKNEACSAIPGAPKQLVDVYPDATQQDAKFCEKLEKLPDSKTLLTPFTALREKDGKLVAVPYDKAYGPRMAKIADELEAAAKDVVDPSEAALKAYLLAAAKSFRTNEWRGADEAWSKMSATNSKWYLRIAPDETYWEPCAQKAGFHLAFARINKDSLAWQKKLEPLQQDMEDTLAKHVGGPYKARKVTFHLPDFIDIVFNSGDDRDAIGATIGQSLPNWGPVAAEGRGRTVAMSNLYADPDSMRVRRSKAESWLVTPAMALYTDDPGPGLLATILHEATHNLGPAHEYKFEGKTDAQAFGGDLSSMLEELKSQSGALFYLDYGKKKGVFSPELTKQTYVDCVVWALNHISRGMWTPEKHRKAYSQLAAVQIGFLLDEGALTWDASATAANRKDKGAFSIDFEKLPAAIDKMMKVVGDIKAKNDKKAAEALSDKYVDGTVVPHAIITERALRFPQPSFVYAVDLLPQVVLGDHHALNFAGAFADLAELGVAKVPLDRELARVAVSAVDLQRAVARARRRFAGVELRHAGLARVLLALIAQHRGAKREQPGRVHLDLRVREHPLDGLEFGDGLSELLTILGVGDGHVDRAVAETERQRRDRDATAIEDLHRVGEAGVDLADAVRVGDANVLEGELDGVARAHAELLEVLRRAETRGAVLDDERGDALVARRFFVRAREHDAEAADAALRDEHLGAVQHPVVALAHGRRAKARRVAARARLGERPGREPLAGDRLRQVLLLLRFAAERQDVTGAEPVVRRDRQRQRAIDARRFEHRDRVRERVHPGAAVLFRNANSEQPHLGQLGHDLVRKTLFLVPLACVRLRFLVEEVAQGLLQELVLLVELESHSDHFPSAGASSAARSFLSLSSLGKQTLSCSGALAPGLRA